MQTLYQLAPVTEASAARDWQLTGGANASASVSNGTFRLNSGGSGVAAATNNVSDSAGALRRRRLDGQSLQWTHIVVQGILRARSFDAQDSCYVEASLNAGETWSTPPIVQVVDGDDIPSSSSYQGVQGTQALVLDVSTFSSILVRVVFDLETDQAHCDVVDIIVSAAVLPTATSTTSPATLAATTSSTDPPSGVITFEDGGSNSEAEWWIYLIVGVATVAIVAVVAVVVVRNKEKQQREEKDRPHTDNNGKPSLPDGKTTASSPSAIDIEDPEENSGDVSDGSDGGVDLHRPDGSERHSRKLSRSMKMLLKSLATPEGQATLEGIANMYYDGDMDKAQQYLMFKLEKEVAQEDGVHEEEERSDIYDQHRSAAWKLKQSKRQLERNLATQDGQRALADIADTYYNGDKRQAKEFLLRKLENEVKSQSQHDDLSADSEEQELADMYGIVAAEDDDTSFDSSDDDPTMAKGQTMQFMDDFVLNMSRTRSAPRTAKSPRKYRKTK